MPLDQFQRRRSRFIVKGTVHRDFSGHFLTCSDRKHQGQEALIVFKIFRGFADFIFIF
jgi:hypothetical protein